MEWLLDDLYDTRHRAFMMTEKKKVEIFVNCHLFCSIGYGITLCLVYVLAGCLAVEDSFSLGN